MAASVELTVIPEGKVSFGLNEYMTECFEMLDKAREKGVTYQATPNGTLVEGELGAVMEVIMQIHEHTFTKGGKRVITTIYIDDRRE